MTESKSQIFRFADVEVREREFSLTKAGQLLTVEPKAFRALLFLLHNPQRLISKEELLNSVWGDAAVTEGSLTRCIWLLRSVLGDDIRSPRYIETVATVGYRWVCKLEVSEDGSEEPVAAKQPNGLAGDEKTVGSGNRWWGWALSGGGVLVLCLAAAIWFLRRPLPPPRILAYAQITHDGHSKYLAGTDGSRLYFARTNQHELNFGAHSVDSICQIALSGGEDAKIPVAVPNSHLEDVSADGSNLLVMSDTDKPGYSLWIVKTLGGQARRLGEAVGASFSPDGNSVAYSTRGDIWLVKNDGTGAHKLASIGDDAGYFAWSPDGGVIRFTKGYSIWEMSSSGSNPHALFPERTVSFIDCCGHWTPDGKLYVFQSTPKGALDRSELLVLDERSGLLRRSQTGPVLLAGGPIRWGVPIPGKDGKTIYAEGQTPRGELSRYDAKIKQFQPFLGGISAQGATFSKDGQYVAYVSYPEAILWKAKRDGSDPVQLTDPSLLTFLPRWSPDGTQVAFVAWSAATDVFRVYLVDADGGSPAKLLPVAKAYSDFPSWSPDGHKIVFNADPNDQSYNGHEVVRIVDLGAGQVTTIPGSYDLNAPRWSPDGRYLAAVKDDVHLEVFDFKAQRWSEIAQKGTVDSPEWSSDGQYIFFRRVKGDLGIFRISIKGGAPEKIVDLKDWHDAGWYGAYMGLDPTDAPLLLRDIGSDDIYALTLEEE